MLLTFSHAGGGGGGGVESIFSLFILTSSSFLISSNSIQLQKPHIYNEIGYYRSSNASTSGAKSESQGFTVLKKSLDFSVKTSRLWQPRLFLLNPQSHPSTNCAPSAADETIPLVTVSLLSPPPPTPGPSRPPPRPPTPPPPPP